MLDETESQSEEVQPDEGQPEVEALEEAVWEPTGGGWYENSITGERVRGKKNIPFGTLLTTSASESSEETRTMCSVCNRVTLHINKTCRVCGEVNA